MVRATAFHGALAATKKISLPVAATKRARARADPCRTHDVCGTQAFSSVGGGSGVGGNGNATDVGVGVERKVRGNKNSGTGGEGGAVSAGSLVIVVKTGLNDIQHFFAAHVLDWEIPFFKKCP